MEDGISDNNKEPTRLPFVTIAIPAFNEEKGIIDTLNSAIKLDYPKEKMEILVMNDGSIDKTRQVVETFIESNKEYLVRLYNQENRGKGASLNVLLSKSGGEIFIPFDADSIIREDAIKKLLPVFEEGEEIAAVLPLMKVWQPKTWIQKIQWAEYMFNLFYKKLMSSLDCISVAPGPFSAYRKSLLEKVGGFSENNLTEDLEISLRLQKYHYKIVQVFNTEVYTKAPTTFKAFYAQRNRWYKGTILNALKYRRMIFNKEYGDFGMLQMPRLMFEGIVVFMIILLVAYSNIVAPLYAKLKMLYFTNLNILPGLKWGINNFRMIDLNFTNIFFSISLTGFAVLLLYYAHKACKEKLTKQGYFAVPSYLLMYGVLAGVVLLGVFFDLTRGKKQRW
ncbi:MAG: glycosyltransferase [Nanoarchaeota archaeon]